MAKKEYPVDWDKVPEVIVAPKNPKKKRGRPTDAVRRAKGRSAPGWWPEEKKIEAVALFATTGNSRRVSELTGVPECTIRSWKTQEWWAEMMLRVKEEDAEEVDAKFNKIVHKALDVISDRLESGDYQYDSKTGQTVRVGVKAKDAAVITAIAVDKRELLRGNVTQRVERVETGDRLKDLAAEFAKFAKSRDITKEVEVIEVIPNTDEADE